MFLLRLLALFRRFLARLLSQLSNFHFFGTVFNFSISFWIHKVAHRRAFPKFTTNLSDLGASTDFDIFFCACISHSGFQTWRWFSFFDTKRVAYSSTEIFKIEASPKVMPVSPIPHILRLVLYREVYFRVSVPYRQRIGNLSWPGATAAMASRNKSARNW